MRAKDEDVNSWHKIDMKPTCSNRNHYTDIRFHYSYVGTR